jgi:hypothetical protein
MKIPKHHNHFEQPVFISKRNAYWIENRRGDKPFVIFLDEIINEYISSHSAPEEDYDIDETEFIVRNLKQAQHFFHSEIQRHENFISHSESILNTFKKRLTEVSRQIAAIKTSGKIPIDEHAIVRYMQRVGSVSKTNYRERILPKDAIKKIKDNEYQDGKYMCDTHVVVLENGIVRTVYKPSFTGSYDYII